MRLPRRFLSCLASAVLLLTAACSQAAASGHDLPSATRPPISTPAATTGCADGLSAAEPCLVGGPEASPTPAMVLIPTRGSGPTTPVPTEIPPTAGQQATAEFETPVPACEDEVCVFAIQQWLDRPIAPPGRDVIDTTYRFGATQEGQRDPHHGVEFLNSFGTPVLAVADGIVEVAGDDRITFYGPYSYFYGNLVVIRHELPGVAQAVFSLYGHLSEIHVTAGDRVTSGQEIGRVGMSGVATGSHLHFEVRLDDNSYAASRNPELWLAPQTGQDGLQNGVLAGRILDPLGNPIAVPNIVIEHLPEPDQPPDRSFYTGTYDEKKLVGLSPWEENFALGDLPAGWYRISFVQNGFQRHLVQVLPGQLTVVTFRPGG